MSIALPRSATWQYAYIAPHCSFCGHGIARYSCGIGTCYKTISFVSCGMSRCWYRLLCISATYRVFGVVSDEVMQYNDVQVCNALVMFGREVVGKYETVLDEDWKNIETIAATVAEKDVARDSVMEACGI